MSHPFVFVSYSKEDEKEKNVLLKHLGVLQNAGLIDLWSDDRIEPGTDWEKEIEQTIARSSVAILLISANFLNSEFVLNKQVPTLLQRQEREGLIIYPVIAKACAWQTIDWLARLSVRPKSGQPVWGDGGIHIDEYLATIAQEIAIIVIEKTSGILKENLISSLRQYSEERFLDAAMPKQVVVNEETELLVMIRMPDSEGLRKILRDEIEFEARPEDVKSKTFDVEFPVDARGNIMFSEIWIDIETTDFTLPERRKKVKVEPLKDTELCIFLLTPKHRGLLRVLIQVYLAENNLLLASGLLKINGRTMVDEGVKAVKTLITLSLGVFGITPDSKVDDSARSIPQLVPEQPVMAMAADDDDDKMVVEDDLPDWLQDVEEEAPPVSEPISATFESDDDKMVADDELPDWLSAAADESFEEDEGDEDLPAWLSDIEEDMEEELPPQPETEPTPAAPIIDQNDIDIEEDDLPDWLKETQENEIAPEPVSSSVLDEVVASLDTDDSVVEEKEAGPYAGMSDLERLLAEEGIDLGTVSEERPEGSEGMSARDFMISTSDDELIRSKVGAEPITEESFAVAPLKVEKAPPVSTSEPETASVAGEEDNKMVVEEDLPDWLKKLRVYEDEEVDAAPQLETPDSIPSPTPPQPVAEAVATPKSTPTVAETEDADKLLSDADERLKLAQSAREKGDIEEAVRYYDSLISSGVYLDKIIEDMQQAIKSYPSNYLLYRVMGDAMMKDNRLRSALVAYREALAILSQ